MSLVLTTGGTTAATLTISYGKVANYTVTVTEKLFNLHQPIVTESAAWHVRDEYNHFD